MIQYYDRCDCAVVISRTTYLWRKKNDDRQPPIYSSVGFATPRRQDIHLVYNNV